MFSLQHTIIEKKAFQAIFLTLTFAFLIFLHLRNLPYSFDDSYIHLRIAKHFVETGFPYFNYNEPVMASSSSAWTIILWILFSLFGPKPEAVAVINAVFCGLGAIIFFRLYLEMNPGQSAAPFAYLVPVVYLCAILLASLGLMEVAVSFAVCGCSLLLFVKKKPYSFIILGCLPFFRMEFIFLTGFLSLYALARKIFDRRVIILNLFLGALPFLLYGFYFFGTIIPNSVIAKFNGYELGYQINLFTLLNYILPTIGEPSLLSQKGHFYLQLILIYLILAAILITIRRQKIPLSDLKILLLGNSLLVCLFYLAGQSIIFPWYAPLFVVPLFVGIMFISGKESLFPKIICFIFVLPIMVSTTTTVFGLSTDQRQYIKNFDENARAAKYISIGKRLYTQYPGAILATSEIGGLGWGFEGYIADGFGLASPAAIKYQDKQKNRSTGAIPSGYILEVNPDLIVSMDEFDRSLYKDDLLANYHYTTEPIFLPLDEKRINRTTLWGSTRIDVFIRNDIYHKASTNQPQSQ